MSTLITRPVSGSTPPAEPGSGRPLAVTAALAGVGAALVGLVVCMSVALTGWFLADAGAHGDTTDALGVGVVAWLTGHGAHLAVSGTPMGMTPLGLTAVLVLTGFRAGRRRGGQDADHHSDHQVGTGEGGHPGREGAVLGERRPR